VRAVFLVFVATVIWGADCSRTSTGFPAFSDFFPQPYRGAATGIYPGGSATRPAAHNALGLKQAAAVVPRFPNLRLVYVSSRIYAGYASSDLNPELYSYQGAFAVKWLIEKQMGGAPWIAWGPYLWADGAIPRAAPCPRHPRSARW
jgi:hypothetical protein